MALPDISTDGISFIGYFNVLDHGASDIDPTEAESGMVGYKEYSNGIEGTVEVPQVDGPNRIISCRVKDDGWIIAWLDRSNEERDHTNDIPQGTYDVMYDWTAAKTNGIGSGQYRPGVADTMMAKAVELLVSELSNSAAITVNRSDVGVHNYEYGGSATTYTVMSKLSTGGSDIHNVAVSAGAKLYDGWAAAYARDYNVTLWQGTGQQHELVDQNNADCGVRNIVGRGEIQPGDTMPVRVWGDNQYVGAQCSIYFLWS